jgi:hypothetical protein
MLLTASAMPYPRKGGNGEGQVHPPVFSAVVFWTIIRVVVLILLLTFFVAHILEHDGSGIGVIPFMHRSEGLCKEPHIRFPDRYTGG